MLLVVADAVAASVFRNPLTWSSVRGRSAGTFVNPNLSALAILSLFVTPLTGSIAVMVLAVAIYSVRDVDADRRRAVDALIDDTGPEVGAQQTGVRTVEGLVQHDVRPLRVGAADRQERAGKQRDPGNFRL